MRKFGIVCAIDVNDYDQDVIDLAAEFAKQFDVDLELLYVTLFPDPGNAAWPAYLGSPQTVIQDNRLLRAMTTTIEGIDVHYHHLSGLPSEQVLGFVERNQPPLLVLGTHGRQGLKRLLGSVASKIMRRASCPVMVLRQRQNSQKFVDVHAT